jgi:putative Holliday junction resolvase
MRILGFDLGTRTLGISISDLTCSIATVYDTLRFEENDYDSILPKIKDIVSKENVSIIVLGLPKNMNNSIGDRALTTLEFKKKLEENMNVEVIMQDERLSTVEATNYMLQTDISRKKRKKKIDSLAANIILQTYLDKRRREENER